MTTLVDRLEQLHARFLSEQPGIRVATRTKLEQELVVALPALLTALRAAHEALDDSVPYEETEARVERLREVVAPLFGEDTAP